jgi:serine/threonine-protein kinase RsbW
VSHLNLTIASELGDVFLVGLAINKVCEHLGMDQVEAYQIELCAVEALTNAIRHAYRNESGHEVSTTVAIGEDRLDLEISDSGTAMSSDQVNRLTQGSAVLDFDERIVESIPEGGMGLQIMHTIMDEVKYSSDGTLNRLCLTKFLRPREPAEPTL